MAIFAVIAKAEAQRQSLAPRRAVQAEYQEYVQQAGGADHAGRLELGDSDRPLTELSRLKAAAKATGIDLEIRRRGNTIVFWKKGAS